MTTRSQHTPSLDPEQVIGSGNTIRTLQHPYRLMLESQPDLLAACEEAIAALHCPTCEDGECGLMWHNRLRAAMPAGNAERAAGSR